MSCMGIMDNLIYNIGGFLLFLGFVAIFTSFGSIKAKAKDIDKDKGIEWWSFSFGVMLMTIGYFLY